jgi:hypothetical protein
MAYGWERSTPEKSRVVFFGIRHSRAKRISLAMPNVALDGDSYGYAGNPPFLSISIHFYPFLDYFLDLMVAVVLGQAFRS